MSLCQGCHCCCHCADSCRPLTRTFPPGLSSRPLRLPPAAWDLDASKLALQLSYLAPDETSLWDERTGVLLTRIETLRFRPCTDPGIVSFPRTTTTITREFTLCPVASGKASKLAPAAAAAAFFKHMP